MLTKLGVGGTSMKLGGRVKPQKVRSTHIQGELEVDYNRGVVYFHATDPEFIKTHGTITLVRIQGLDIPATLPVDLRA